MFCPLGGVIWVLIRGPDLGYNRWPVPRSNRRFSASSTDSRSFSPLHATRCFALQGLIMGFCPDALHSARATQPVDRHVTYPVRRPPAKSNVLRPLADSNSFPHLDRTQTPATKQRPAVCRVAAVCMILATMPVAGCTSLDRNNHFFKAPSVDAAYPAIETSESDSQSQNDLQQLVDEELSSLPPSERQQLINDLSKLDPGQSLLTLQMRRNMRSRYQGVHFSNSEWSGPTRRHAGVRLPEWPLASSAESPPMAPQDATNPFAVDNDLPRELTSEQASVPFDTAKPTVHRSVYTDTRETPATTVSQPSSMTSAALAKGELMPQTPEQTTGRSPQSDAVISVSAQITRAAAREAGTSLAGSAAPARPRLPGQSASTATSTPPTSGPGDTEDALLESETQTHVESNPPPSNRSEELFRFRQRFSQLGARLGFGGQVPRPEPVPDPAPPETTTDVGQLITRLEQDLAGLPTPGDKLEQEDFIRRHVQLRLLYLLDGRSAAALDAIPGASASEQEFWQQMFWSLNDYFDIAGCPDRTDRMTQAVEQLRLAVQRLREEARLEIRNINFCRKIASYGNYDRFRRDEFSAGQAVLVYAEIDNFRTQAAADGHYRTSLNASIEIFADSSEKEAVQAVNFEAVEDLCRNPRQDYFHSYEFTIPRELIPGPHVLRLTIEDQLSGKQATQDVHFTVK